MADDHKLDRRAFLELAAASTVVAAAGATAAGCQDAPGAAPTPPLVTPPSSVELALLGPLRSAVVPDDVPPAMVFRPLPQRRS